MDGHVSEWVAKLTARSGDGLEEELPLYESGRFDLTFVAFAPIEAAYGLTAYDDDGEVLDRRVLTRAELDPEG